MNFNMIFKHNNTHRNEKGKSSYAEFRMFLN